MTQKIKVSELPKFDMAEEDIRLSLADQECFAQALLSPPQPAPALERAFARRRKLLARDFNQTVIERVGREPASVSGASSR